VSPDELVPLFIRTAPVDEAPLPKSKIAERDEEVAILTSVFDFPMLIVVAFVVPMLRVVTLLSTDSNFAVEELKTDTFVVPSIVVAVFDFPMLIVVAFVVPMLRVVALLSTDSNFAVEELKTDTFVVPSIVLVAVDEPRVKEPLVKLSQMLKSEVELFACILLIYAVPVTI